MQETGAPCPQHKFGPVEALEHRAARVAASDGVWRWDWREEKSVAGEFIRKRYPQGLIMTEALSRCPVDDEADHETLVGYFQAIEAGALAGAHVGWESERERAEEDGEV